MNCISVIRAFLEMHQAGENTSFLEGRERIHGLQAEKPRL